MGYNSSSWYPLKNFTKSNVDKDWMMGATKFGTFKDALYPERKIRRFETVFWNRSKNNATIALSSYEDAIRNNDPEALRKLKELGIPQDIIL